MMGMDQIQKGNLKDISVVSEQPVSKTCVTTGAPRSNILSLILPTHQIWSGKMFLCFLLFQKC